MTIAEFFTVKGVPAEVKHEFKLTCLKRRERIGQTVSGLMIDYIARSGFDVALWKGFVRVRWSEVKLGDEVWIAGTNLGKPFAYGPHTVADAEERILRNKMGTAFYQNQDDLLRKGV